MSGILSLSDRDRIRTCDRLLRRQMLYPAELLDHCKLGCKLKNFLLLKNKLSKNLFSI